MDTPSTSLNKYISSTGICSRREADKWIDAGRVKINGEVAQKGNRVFEGDTVTVDDQPLKQKPKPVYIVLHKPPGITCTTDRRDPTNIIDFVKHPQRVFPIGRLDKGSTGLILLTNDGDIVNEVLRTENNHDKEYIVKVDQAVNKRFVQRMSKGVPILGTTTKACIVEPLSRFVFKIILTQGLNRQIRRMCEYLGYKVVSIKRIRVMNIELGKLPSGQWRNLTANELATLYQLLGQK
jgi:23S rRNA pseudouridine2604 synthase